jgi:hypothetical protein
VIVPGTSCSPDLRNEPIDGLRGAHCNLDDHVVEMVALRNDARPRQCTYCAGADVKGAEPPATRCGPFVRIDDRRSSEHIQVEGVQVCRNDCNRCTRGDQARTDRRDLVADARLPRHLLQICRLVRSRYRPRKPVDLMQHLNARRRAPVRRRPLRDQARSVSLALARPARERTHGAGEFGDLAPVVESLPVACERGDPPRIRAGGELTLGVDDGMQLHCDARVEV